MRVIVLDHHPIVRAGVRALLGTYSGFELVAEGAAAHEALPLFRSSRPDIVLMDLQFRDGSGLDAIRTLRLAEAASRVVVLTDYDDGEHVWAASTAGAQGYVLKHAAPTLIVDALRAVHAGRRYFDANASLRLAERIHGGALTRREQEVLELLAAGARNKSIALRLGISEETVKGHIKNILAKLRANGRAEAISKAIQRGLVCVPKGS